MPKYMCITTCLLPKKAPTGRPYQELIPEGTIITASQSPSHHFIRIDTDMVGKDLKDILIEKISGYKDVYVDENMDVQQIQGILVDLRQQEQEKPDADIVRKVLRSHGIKFHHKLGLKRLLKLIKQNDLEDELKDEKKIKE